MKKKCWLSPTQTALEFAGFPITFLLHLFHNILLKVRGAFPSFVYQSVKRGDNICQWPGIKRRQDTQGSRCDFLNGVKPHCQRYFGEVCQCNTEGSVDNN